MKLIRFKLLLYYLLLSYLCNNVFAIQLQIIKYLKAVVQYKTEVIKSRMRGCGRLPTGCGLNQ